MASKYNRKMSDFCKVAIRGFRIIWSVSPPAALFYYLVNILNRLLELTAIWATKLIVDHVTEGRVEAALVPVGLFALCIGLRWVFARIGRSVSIYLDSRFPIHTAAILQEKVRSFRGIALFEDPGFHNALDNARRGAHLASLLSMLSWIVADGVYFVSIVLMLARYHVLVPLVVLVAATPRAILQHRYESSVWSIRKSGASEARKMAYFSDVVTGDDHAKEVRLFGLGNTFISPTGMPSLCFTDVCTANACARLSGTC